jgi:hypothetical protein
LLASSAIGQVQTIIEIAAPGRYVATVGANGQLSVAGPVATISPGGVVPVPVPPNPPVVPPVVPPTPVTKADQIKAAAVAVTDPQKATTAANLATLMGLIESQVKAGTIKDYPAISATVNWMWDQMTKGRESNWKPVKDLIGSHLAAMAQEGAQPEEYAGYFADAGDAISSAVPVTYEAAEDELNINIDTLMKLFEFFIKYILPMILK